MHVRKTWWVVLVLATLMAGFPPRGAAQDSLPRVDPSVLLQRQAAGVFQRLYIDLPQAFPRRFTLKAEHRGGAVTAACDLKPGATWASIDVPACPSGDCPVVVKVIDARGVPIASMRSVLRPIRPWKVYCAPFTHIDIGFTQSQRKVLQQNLRNLESELDLLDRTQAYPPGSPFKLFTEVSWAVDEFLKSGSIDPAQKRRLIQAITEGRIEPGAFYISHQNKFMPAEALFASLLPALRVAEQTGKPIDTACIHDVFDFSKVVKPLAAAGVKYLLVGPNDTRYVVPPLFYLTPPVGNERVLVWHSTGLNGYGENFDLKMRLAQPWDDAAFAAMERSLSRHLNGLEGGYPTPDLERYYSYYGAHWEYPYDAFFLPYYPAQGGDNQPQNIVPSEIAKAWNAKWASPRMIVATPREFFAAMEERYQAQIPVIRGDMAGFWGEQIYLDLLQVDPDKHARQLAFERDALNSGMLLTEMLLKGKAVTDPQPALWEGYAPLILNNDHNPRPVTFGKTDYDKHDVQEWKDTRQAWIERMTAVGAAQYAALGAMHPAQDPEAVATARAYRRGDEYILENRWYTLTVDGASGGIKSLIDRETRRELVDCSGGALLNQYLVAVRGENLGLRDYLQIAPGFTAVRITIPSQPGPAKLLITGRCCRSVNGSNALARFLHNAFGLSLPDWCVRMGTSLATWGQGRPLELVQEISLPADEKRVEFVQRFSGARPQLCEHLFAYPLRGERTVPLFYDAAYSLQRFQPAPPLGEGDIIPAARMTAPFPSINDTLFPFQWMYGVPPDFTFDNYVLHYDQGQAVVFAARESRAVIPGRLPVDPEIGPQDNGFYHCAYGMSMWGHLGLGSRREKTAVFHGALTSFPAPDLAEARHKAFAFGRRFNGVLVPGGMSVSPAAVAVVAAWPQDNGRLVLRLWETAGRPADVSIRFDTDRTVVRAALARADGQPRTATPHHDREVTLAIGPGEVRTLAVDFNK